MFKNFTLLFVFLFIASTSFAATVTVGGNIALRHDYVSDVDHDKDTKGDSTSEFRTYADFWANSQINDQLSGLISLKFWDAAANQYEVWGAATGFYPYVYEAYVNYLPIEGLNVRVGRQAWKMGDGMLIGDYSSASNYISQSGLNLSYEMPELFKANLLVSVEGAEGSSANTDGDDPIKSSKFYALWLNTTALPGQNINLVYAANYKSWDVDLTDPADKLDDNLTTMGISASGGLPVGPAVLVYMADYYMNGGKQKEADRKYKGTYMRAALGGIMPQLYGLKAGLAYIAISGDKENDADLKAYYKVHDGATMFTDSAKLFGGYAGIERDNATGLSAGLNIIIAQVGAKPVKDLDLTLEYVMKNAAEKEITPTGDKAGLATDMVLKADYKGLENLDLMFAVGQQKLNKDNFPTMKDGQLKTKLVATYKF